MEFSNRFYHVLHTIPESRFQCFGQSATAMRPFQVPKTQFLGAFEVYVSFLLGRTRSDRFQGQKPAKNDVFHDLTSKNTIFDHFSPIRFKIRQQIRIPREILRRYVYTTFYSTKPRNPKICPKTVKNQLKIAKISPKQLFFPVKFILACPAQQKRNVNFKGV